MTDAVHQVVLLGSTGSIGTQALEVLGRLNRSQPSTGSQRVTRVVGLAAGGTHLAELAEQAVAHEVPRLAVSTTGDQVVERLRDALARRTGKRG